MLELSERPEPSWHPEPSWKRSKSGFEDRKLGGSSHDGSVGYQYLDLDELATGLLRLKATGREKQEDIRFCLRPGSGPVQTRIALQNKHQPFSSSLSRLSSV